MLLKKLICFKFSFCKEILNFLNIFFKNKLKEILKDRNFFKILYFLKCYIVLDIQNKDFIYSKCKIKTLDQIYQKFHMKTFGQEHLLF